MSFYSLPALGLADVLGIVAVACGALWPLLRSRLAMVAVQAVATACFCAHFGLLGAWTGAAVCVAALVQLALAWPESRGRWIKAGYAATVAGVAGVMALTWAGPASAGAAFGLLCSTIGRWQTCTVRMRLWFLACVAGWMTHNILVGSPYGLACDALTIAANLVGLWRARAVPRAAAPAVSAAAAAA